MKMRTTKSYGNTAALYRVEIQECRRDIKLWQCYKNYTNYNIYFTITTILFHKHDMNKETIFFSTKYLSINISVLFVVYLMVRLHCDDIALFADGQMVFY